jgi:hypothetical protein
VALLTDVESIYFASVVGLPAYFSSNQWVIDKRFLPEIQFSKSTQPIEDFNPKSINTREIVRKVYNV